MKEFGKALNGAGIVAASIKAFDASEVGTLVEH